jgi:hypothetical protein
MALTTYTAGEVLTAPRSMTTSPTRSLFDNWILWRIYWWDFWRGCNINGNQQCSVMDNSRSGYFRVYYVERNFIQSVSSKINIDRHTNHLQRKRIRCHSWRACGGDILYGLHFNAIVWNNNGRHNPRLRIRKQLGNL